MLATISTELSALLMGVMTILAGVGEYLVVFTPLCVPFTLLSSDLAVLLNVNALLALLALMDAPVNGEGIIVPVGVRRSPSLRGAPGELTGSGCCEEESCGEAGGAVVAFGCAVRVFGVELRILRPACAVGVALRLDCVVRFALFLTVECDVRGGVAVTACGPYV